MSGLVLMGVVAAWSLALAAGFASAAVTGGGLGPAARVGFVLVAVFLGLLGARTAYELLRRLRGRGPDA